MRYRFYQSGIVFGLLLGVALTCMEAQKSQGSPSNQSQRRLAIELREKWSTGAWVGSEKPFRDIRNGILKRVATGEDPNRLEKTYGEQARKYPFSPVDQFRWAYAAYVAATKVQPFDENKVQPALTGMERAISPRTYEYTRLRFLLASRARLFEEREDLLVVGKRLWERQPKDREVLARYRYLLSASSYADRELGVKLSQQWVRDEPKSVSARANLGDAWRGLWFHTRKKEHRLAAIKVLKEQMEMSPNDSWVQTRLKRIIQTLEKSKDGQPSRMQGN